MLFSEFAYWHEIGEMLKYVYLMSLCDVECVIWN